MIKVSNTLETQKQNRTLHHPGTHRNEAHYVFPDRKHNPHHCYEIPLEVFRVTRNGPLHRTIGLNGPTSKNTLSNKRNNETPGDIVRKYFLFPNR